MDSYNDKSKLDASGLLTLFRSPGCERRCADVTQVDYEDSLQDIIILQFFSERRI